MRLLLASGSTTSLQKIVILHYYGICRRMCDLSSKQDLYSILGISRNSTQNEIKSAYYKLSFIYHPDKNVGDEEAVRRFQEIRHAYEVLGHSELKERYDRKLTPKPITSAESEISTDPNKIHWLKEDYTTFYQQRKERFNNSRRMNRSDNSFIRGTAETKSAGMASQKENFSSHKYGAYFQPHATAKNQKITVQKSGSGEIAVFLIFGIGVIFAIQSQLYTDDYSEPKNG